MAKPNKTVQTDASVEAYFAAIADPARRADCQALAALMARAAGAPAKMWGAGIVGFGSYHYRYESGREGDMPVLGFSSRKEAMALYIGAGDPAQAPALERLGKYSMGKGCLYIRKLSDVDPKVLGGMFDARVASHRT